MVILLVSDLHKLITFYKEVLGMKVKHESEDWVELSTKEGSTRLALHLLQKQARDQKQAEQTATVTSVIKIRTMFDYFYDVASSPKSKENKSCSI